MLLWKKKDSLDDPLLGLKGILDNFLDPIFKYIDCDGDGWINAEQLFLGLRELKRNTTYGCISIGGVYLLYLAFAL